MSQMLWIMKTFDRLLQDARAPAHLLQKRWESPETPKKANWKPLLSLPWIWSYEGIVYRHKLGVRSECFHGHVAKTMDLHTWYTDFWWSKEARSKATLCPTHYEWWKLLISFRMLTYPAHSVRHYGNLQRLRRRQECYQNILMFFFTHFTLTFLP